MHCIHFTLLKSNINKTYIVCHHKKGKIVRSGRSLFSSILDFNE